MMADPRQITLDEWDEAYALMASSGLNEPVYGGRLSRHLKDGNKGIERLMFDNSCASLDLWNFLLTEEDRLHQARASGKALIGTMKDLGTLPVMVYAHPDLVAFYPDGAWWIPCLMDVDDGLLAIADRLGVDSSFCPVRAMLGAFVTGVHFPIPDLLLCSVGATCDDFSAIAQRVEGLGHPILWWEIPQRREPCLGEDRVKLPGGFYTTADQIFFVKSELTRIIKAIANKTGITLTDSMLSDGIVSANKIRMCLAELREIVFTAERSPLPALELLVAEMMAIHFCSDRNEVMIVLERLLETVKQRVSVSVGYFAPDSVRVFWINPVADLRVMNMLEACGGRICGTEYLFTHALDQIPTDMHPLEALARMALADPMVGSAQDRASRICRDIQRFGSEAVVISRIPGASHCALEGAVIKEVIRSLLDIPVVEIEVSSVTDTFQASLRTRLGALIETVKEQRVGV
ncbi:MAG: 2-hydroxyacyl-CoA dehydratase [Candidatus Omnitrophica bacterium]|nr:2-hydroxyacyl-CoA dehydratase [Candidatus Omnitrophota bacterium]